MKLESFWQATAPAFTGAAREPLPAQADVVVIGGGGELARQVIHRRLGGA